MWYQKYLSAENSNTTEDAKDFTNLTVTILRVYILHNIFSCTDSGVFNNLAEFYELKLKG